VATDFTEGAFGDSWTQYMNVNAGEWYILFIDNFYAVYWGIPFDLTFQFQGVGGVGPPASINCVLPVELLSFSGKPTGTTVELNWSTGSERTSDYFMVERSQDGVQFQPIGRVEAAGNSGSLNEYVLVDKAPLQGTNYYRLRQVDTDGASETSHTISVDFQGRTTALHLLPNPATESIQASFDLPMGERFHWRITDASGRVVKEGTSTSVDGPDQLEIDLGTIESGAYALGLFGTSDGSFGQARFVKQ